MNTTTKILYKGALLTVLTFGLSACDKDLTETNKSPNVLAAEDIKPSFILTEVLSGSARQNTRMVYGTGVGTSMLLEAMQYTQRDYLESSVVNTFLWFPQSWDPDYYLPLANSSYLLTRATGDADEAFLKGVALTMRAYWFGFLTSAWGDIPYSEAMRAEEGVLKPVYDPQKEVFKGILAELEQANELLTGASASSFTQTADILYNGDPAKWRQFANSLHLRFLMRLSEKTADMQAIGVDVQAEVGKIVSDPGKYPLITQSGDNAAVSFPGNTEADSWPGGEYNWSNRSEFYRRKSGSTIVDFLKDTRDPRLTVWIRPVDVQTLVRDKGADQVIQMDSDGRVRRYIKTYQAGVDTSLYVGMKIALQDPDSYNKKTSADINAVKALDPSIYTNTATNPFVSYLADRYGQNTDPLVKSVFITAAEVNFILAEAALRNWIPGSAVEYYKNGIRASLDQYAIADGDQKVYDPETHAIKAFDMDAFLSDAEAIFNAATDKLEPIMTQSWASNFMNGEAWFNWRRTGYPDLGGNIIAGGNGDKIPVRYAYGDAEQNFNAGNVGAAIQNLEPAVNDQWSKMWLIQGTGKPW